MPSSFRRLAQASGRPLIGRGVRQVVFSQTPSYALSTFTTNDWDFTADNVDDATDTLTVYDSNGALMTGALVVFTSEDTLVDAAECTLASDVAEIETTTGTANITAYVLNASGVPLPGIPAASLSLASTGTGNTITALDTVTDRNGRFRWTFSSTVSEAKTLTLTALGIVVTDTAAVTVTSPTGDIAGIFTSAFSTATGTTANALNDGGAWDVYGTGSEVISSAGLDFPTTNVLLVPWQSGGGSALQLVGPPYGTSLGALTAPATRYYRWYGRIVIPNGTADTQTHPVQDGTGGATNWTQLFYNNVGDDVVRVGHGFQNNTYPHNIYLGPTLSKGVTYRFEYAYELVTSTTFRFAVRIYSSADVLLYTSDDFTASGLGVTTLADYCASNTFTVNSATTPEGFHGGTNDLGSEAGDYAYESGFAISDVGWCEAYGHVTGE